MKNVMETNERKKIPDGDASLLLSIKNYTRVVLPDIVSRRQSNRRTVTGGRMK